MPRTVSSPGPKGHGFWGRRGFQAAQPARALWHARMVMKTLHRAPREAIAEAAGLPWLDSTAQIAIAATIDLAHSTLLGQIDDHVAFAGMETDPNQETDKPTVVAA